MLHDDCQTIVIGFAGSFSVKSFVSPFPYARVRTSSCRVIQTTRLSRARRQRCARMPVSQNAQYESTADGLSAVPPTSEKEPASGGTPRPTLRPPPQRNLEQLTEVNGESFSIQSLSNGKETETVTFDADSSHDVLHDNHSDYDEELDDTIHDDLDGMDDADEPNRNSSSFSASHRKPVRAAFKSNFGSKRTDILPRKEFGPEQQIVDEAEKRLRQELFGTASFNSRDDDAPFLSLSDANVPSDENDTSVLGSNGNMEFNEISMSEALRQEGHIAESKGHHSLAGSFYLRSIHYNANNGKAWQNLAKSEGRRKQSMRASAHVLRRALQHNPKNAFLWQSLGFLLFRMRQYESARMHFEKGIAVDPNHAPLYSTWAHMEYGMKEIDRARELYDKGSKIDKGGARVFQNWGQMEEKLGNHDRAMELYEKGLQLEPLNPFLLETLGINAAKNKDFTQARNYFRAAMKSDEHQASICESFAEMEGRLGNHDEARKLFEQGVSADVKNSRVLRSWSMYELKVRFSYSALFNRSYLFFFFCAFNQIYILTTSLHLYILIYSHAV